ncbi:MAG: EscR/YscR/HrcR family type III secretion system export apparatus protein [Polyangiaceae bacterium]
MIIAIADAGAPAIAVGDLLSRPIALVVALAIVSLLPFAFMTVTAFLKIATVLQIVRSAIGAQGVPSSTVIMALAGALTLIAMAPVGSQIAARAAPLFVENASGAKRDTVTLVREGIDAVREPLRQFLKENASDVERARFLDVALRARRSASKSTEAQQSRPASTEPGADDLTVLLPAFIVTQLGEAFAVGFLIYLPFLVIDLVVSNVLLALGMQMMSPTQVSMPFKLLLFVAIDGWGLLARSLVAGYAG